MDTNSTYVVYIMRIYTNTSPHTYKFGYTKDIERRLAEHKCDYGEQVEIYDLFPVNSEISARFAEVLFDQYCIINDYKSEVDGRKELFGMNKKTLEKCCEEVLPEYVNAANYLAGAYYSYIN